MNDQFTLPPLPRGWTVTTVAEAGATSVGQSKTPASAPGERLQYLRAINVQDQELNFADLASMPFDDPEKHLLHAGDILLAEGSGSRTLVGRAPIYRGQADPLYIQNSVLRFRPSPSVNSEYALLVFRAYQKNGVFSEVAKGSSGITHLGLGCLKQLPFPVPPIDIQGAIAATASAVQDNLDMITRTADSAVPVLTDLVPEIRDLEILGRHLGSWSKGTAGSAPFPIHELAEIVDPDASVLYGILQPGPDVPDGIPYVRGMDLQQGRILTEQLQRTSSKIAAENSRAELRAGDVLLNIIRHTRVAVVPLELDGAYISRSTARVRPGTRITTNYLAHWLSSNAAQNWLAAQMRGIDMPGLNLRDVRRLPVPLPDKTTQEAISAKLDNVLSKAAELIARLQRLLLESPLLEAELLKSLAYGDFAAQLSGVAPTSPHSSSRPQPVVGQEAAIPDAGNPKASDEGVVLAVTPGQIEVVGSEEIVQALAESQGGLSPEYLFSVLKLSEDAVDSFYSELRALTNQRKVEILRPDDTATLVRLVA